VTEKKSRQKQDLVGRGDMYQKPNQQYVTFVKMRHWWR